MKLLKWLSVTDRFTKAYLDSRLAPLGINSSQHMYLLKVCSEPGITQDSFLASFYVHPSNVVRMVTALEKKGFLTKVPSDQDKRTWCLFPTEKALSVMEQIQIVCRETEAFLTEDISDEERKKFGDLLLNMGKKMAEELNVERMEDEFDE